jgi:hypothetical protein
MQLVQIYLQHLRSNSMQILIRPVLVKKKSNILLPIKTTFSTHHALLQRWKDNVCGVIESLFAWSAVEHVKPNIIKFCCFLSPSKHGASRSKIKDWLAWNLDNVSEWSDMSTCGLLFQWASTINILQCEHLIKSNLFSTWFSLEIVQLVLNNNHYLIGWKWL